MKSLVNFIKESLDTKIITFDFTDVDNAEATVQSVMDMDSVSVDGSKIMVTVTKDTYNKLDTVQDIIQQAVQVERKGTKSTNNEQYAQKIAALERNVSELADAIDSFNADSAEDKNSEE